MENLQRPKTVKKSIIMAMLSLLIGPIKLYIELSSVVDPSRLKSMMAVMLSFIAILGFFLFLIWKGKDWSRFIFSVFIVLGSLPFFQVIVQELDENFFLAGLSGLQLVLQISAVILLYLPISNSWFSSVKASKDI